MTCPEMIEAMATKGYWTSPGGKTLIHRAGQDADAAAKSLLPQLLWFLRFRSVPYKTPKAQKMMMMQEAVRLRSSSGFQSVLQTRNFLS
jgi:hypothetical protein